MQSETERLLFLKDRQEKQGTSSQGRDYVPRNKEFSRSIETAGSGANQLGSNS